jgi:5-methylcytosine-specific restriction endonuclease McrA
VTGRRKKVTASKEADALFGKIVRSPGFCRYCGSTVAVQCAHGFSRRYRATRWDLRNAWPLCRACHMRFTHNPLAWDEYLLETWGQALYAEMRALALNGPTPDPRDIVAELRPIWQQLEAA